MGSPANTKKKQKNGKKRQRENDSLPEKGAKKVLKNNNGGKKQIENDEENSQKYTLQVEDAVAYLERVQKTFTNKPKTFVKFQSVMHEHYSAAITVPQLIKQIEELFRGHDDLIIGFNTFLPPGTTIEPSKSMEEYEKMKDEEEEAETTAEKEMGEEINEAKMEDDGIKPQEMGPALKFISLVRKEIEPSQYKNFLASLHQYRKNKLTLQETCNNIKELIEPNSDLLHQFTQFLPNPSKQKIKETTTTTLQRKKAGQKNKFDTIQEGMKITPNHHLLVEPHRPEYFHRTQNTYLGYLLTIPDFMKTMKSKLSPHDYEQFLKFMDMYNQQIINKFELLEFMSNKIPADSKEADMLRIYLSRSYKLFQSQRDDWLNQRERFARQNSTDFGPSYRLLPKNTPKPVCSHRTDLCHEVLNDELVSVRSGKEEGRTDIGALENAAEMVYQCEDDRVELDIVRENNQSTIHLLAPYVEEIKAGVPLTFNFTMDIKDIHKAAITRLYGKRSGTLLQSLKNKPEVAIPLLYGRLQQKGEEWDSARKELNTLWRKMYQSNRITAENQAHERFKQADQKRLLPKTILKDIEQRHLSHFEAKLKMLDKSIHNKIYGLVMKSQVVDAVKAKSFWSTVIIPFFKLKAAGETTTTDKPKEEVFTPVRQEVNGKIKPLHFMTGNEPLVLFFRYYMFLFERLSKAKGLCKRRAHIDSRREKLKDTPTVIHEYEDHIGEQVQGRIEGVDEATNSLSAYPKAEKIEGDYFEKLLETIDLYLSKNLKENEYEAMTKRLMGFESYTMLTFKKLLNALLTQLNELIDDEHVKYSTELFQYELKSENPFQSDLYLTKVKDLANKMDNGCYTLKFNYATRRITICLEKSSTKLNDYGNLKSYHHSYLRNDLPTSSKGVYLERNINPNANLIDAKQSNALEFVIDNSKKMQYVKGTCDAMVRPNSRSQQKFKPFQNFDRLVEVALNNNNMSDSQPPAEDKQEAMKDDEPKAADEEKEMKTET